MGGCCCCCASKNVELNSSPPFYHYPRVSEEREPLSPHAGASGISTGLLVDTNLDTSVPDTYRPPPAPIPYETYVGRPSTPSGIHGNSANRSEVVPQTTDVASVDDANPVRASENKVKNLDSDEKLQVDIAQEPSKEMEDGKSDETKKSGENIFSQLQEEEDVCPICLEEYDEENPKLITKCDHHFHLACILEWMERSDTCPVCSEEMILSPAIDV